MAQIQGKQIASGTVTSTQVNATVTIASGANAFTGDQSMGGHKLTNLGTPTTTTDAVTKAYADALISSLSPKQSVRVATATTLPAYTFASGGGGADTLTANANGALVIDGITVSATGGPGGAPDRVLVWLETGGNAKYNGIYDVTDAGSAGTPFVVTRSVDARTAAEIAGAYVFAENGSTYSGQGFVLPLSFEDITFDTTALNFVEFTASTFPGYGSSAATVSATTNTAGAATTVSRSDHAHTVSTGTPSTTVQSEAGTATTGSAATLIRTDARLLAATAAPATPSLGASASQGTSTSLSRADHIHPRDVEQQEVFYNSASGNSPGTVISGTDTALSYSLAAVPVPASSGGKSAGVQLFLNGIAQYQGTAFDYIISGQTITWLASSGTGVSVSATDVFEVKYKSAT